MILKTFAIMDKALDSFGGTFQQNTIEAGIRMFRDIVLYGDENNRYKRNPEDFTLYQVGGYDDSTGKLLDVENVRLASAIEIIAEIKKGE